MSAGAVCNRCGGARADFRDPCPSCGLEPAGEGLLVAWLLSSEHLTPEQMAQATQRIRNGEPIHPNAAMLRRARKALGASFGSDPGMSLRQGLGLLAVSILLTPLVGWTCWAYWLRSRPRAAWQAFTLSLPSSLVFGALGIYLHWFHDWGQAAAGAVPPP